MYEAMIKSHMENNAIANKENETKLYRYTLLGKDFSEIRKGKCKHVSFNYDVCYDYNVVTFTDIDTGEKMSRCQFYLDLEEITQ